MPDLFAPPAGGARAPGVHRRRLSSVRTESGLLLWWGTAGGGRLGPAELRHDRRAVAATRRVSHRADPAGDPCPQRSAPRITPQARVIRIVPEPEPSAAR